MSSEVVISGTHVRPVAPMLNETTVSSNER